MVPALASTEQSRRFEQDLLFPVWPQRPRTGALLARAAIYTNEVPTNTGSRSKQRATGERQWQRQLWVSGMVPPAVVGVVMAVLLSVAEA